MAILHRLPPQREYMQRGPRDGSVARARADPPPGGPPLHRTTHPVVGSAATPRPDWDVDRPPVAGRGGRKGGRTAPPPARPPPHSCGGYIREKLRNIAQGVFVTKHYGNDGRKIWKGFQCMYIRLRTDYAVDRSVKLGSTTRPLLQRVQQLRPIIRGAVMHRAADHTSRATEPVCASFAPHARVFRCSTEPTSEKPSAI